ncbi:MAG: polyhydroxyalkanoate synthesis regulator DNA-binding domain-containing protein [Deltaproteobacteria bacterium]|nr:polyhydroxyalkanoate synthesis regulator DNA-binding domain-containing protein [Deltaproteobacteria bacterium]MBW2089878.1 polyhydroxyalkanoate synthesis regulator DNA-binding domain-containing protein [Deltaproteobacteria bacterium]OQY11865.1 MAG: transcriptional regulator [Desulfobacteraceae bacterium 4572_187]
MSDKVKLKKYANRRLYDTGKSAYVTLSQVADLIRQGRQVEVIDAKSKEDVTASILSQIILEEAKNKNILLPVPVLHLIIQYGDNVLGDFFEKYLQQMIQTYLAHKHAVDDQFKKWLEMGMGFSNMAQETMAALSPFKSFFDQFSSFSNKQEQKKEEE